MNKEYCLYLEDIQHTGHHGPEGESKVGDKYDRRRNTYCRLIPTRNFIKGESIGILYYETIEEYKKLLTAHNICTTPFVSYSEDDDYVILRTMNSIYRFKKILMDQ